MSDDHKFFWTKVVPPFVIAAAIPLLMLFWRDLGLPVN